MLAIAGLIMVIVFLAVPALERNQRDNARQSIANRVKAEIETYAGNNQGSYPFKTSCSTTGCISDFVNRYIGTGSAAPSTCNPPDGKVNTCDPTLGEPVMTGANDQHGQPRSVSGFALPSGTTAGRFYIITGAKCSGENVIATGTPGPGSRNYAILMGLDRDGTWYCVDNG